MYYRQCHLLRGKYFSHNASQFHFIHTAIEKLVELNIDLIDQCSNTRDATKIKCENLKTPALDEN